MPDHQPLSCYIIGEGTLPIQCAEMVLDRGHRLLGIVSPDSALLEWAAARGIPAFPPTTDLPA
jgi:hypothetical protein